MSNNKNDAEVNGGFEGDNDNERNVRLRNMPQTTSVDVVNVNEDDEEEEDIKKEPTKPSSIEKFMTKNKNEIKMAIIITFNALIVGYFIFATFYHEKYQSHCGMEWCTGYGMLVLIFSFVYFGIFYYKFVKKYYGERIAKAVINPIENGVASMMSKLYMRIIAVLLFLVAFFTYAVIDTSDARYRMRSIIAIVILFGIGYVFSKSRSQIRWRTVIIGFVFQLILGFICIRWETGRSIFDCFGEKVKTFLNYSLEGATFVFSEELIEIGVFAFSVLPVIFFFSFCISILYYLGAMQWFVTKLGWILQATLGTTVCESVTAAANIFLGMSESPLLIRPYIKVLTHSEIHSIMTSGFATVSGTVLAAFINFGAEPAHLITASVMAAPAALMFSKLFYPETEKSKTKSDNIQMEASEDSSLLDAASNGATIAIPLVLGIIANLVAFVSFIAFINGVLSFLGILVGIEDFSLKYIFQYGFMPLAYILGVPWDESRYVGELIATKMIINEFVAYKKLGEFKAEGLLTGRSAAIATYSICGFANPSSLGIMIASLSAMAPSRRDTITSVAFRAFISGSCVCFLTASIAGLLMPSDMFPVGGNNDTTTTILPDSTMFDQFNY